MSATERLPRLMDKKSIAAELNVPLPTAAQIMRHVPKVKVGRRVFVLATDVDEWIEKEKRS